MLSMWLMSLGLTRDSGVWLWARIVAVAAIVAAGGVDIVNVGDWLGFHVTDVWAHRVTAICVAVLWISGKYDSSPLPGGKK